MLKTQTPTDIMLDCILRAEGDVFDQTTRRVWRGTGAITNNLQRHQAARDTLAELLEATAIDFWPDGLLPPWQPLLQCAWEQINWPEVADKVLGQLISQYKPLELPW